MTVLLDFEALAARANERQRDARSWLLRSSSDYICDTCRVKLCGISRQEDADAVAKVGPELCGFIVDFPRSHRNVSHERLAELCARLDASAPDVWRVGVFVDEPIDELLALLSSPEPTIDLVQLHGHEDAAYVAALRARTDVGIIQAFRVRTAVDVARAEKSKADMVLLDNGQGTGESFDWSLLTGDARPKRPFVLAGGLAPENVYAAIDAVCPWGVDISSGIETDGVKDPSKMLAAVAAVRGEANGKLA